MQKEIHEVKGNTKGIQKEMKRNTKGNEKEYKRKYMK